LGVTEGLIWTEVQDKSKEKTNNYNAMRGRNVAGSEEKKR
jgi:hypothetical protein